MRVQDREKLLRFYLDDKMVDVRKFDHTLSSIPSNSQMRLAQAFEIMMEGTAEITTRFIVSHGHTLVELVVLVSTIHTRPSLLRSRS